MPAESPDGAAETALADVERQRLRALVAGDLRRADELHAGVRTDSGCLRYRSTIEIVVDGRKLPPTRCWHTGHYERRDGRWQVVWSQATATSGVDELQ